MGLVRVHTPHRRITALLLLSSILLQGCAAGPFRLQYLWTHDEGLSYYVDKASALEYPTTCSTDNTDADLFNAPRRIDSLDDVDPREVSLNECLRMAMAETAVIRDDGSFGSPGNPILSQPSRVASTLDPAIQATGYLFGNRGYEAALSDFDALFTTSATWGRDEVPQNSANLGLAAGDSLVQETMAWQTSLEKTFANGGTVTLQNNTNYDGNNRPTGPGLQRFASSYNGLVQIGYRQPLLAGSGTDFNLIAGPQSQSLRGVSGVSQGVLISRINGDIALTQFEQSMMTLVRDVEQRYWDLNLFLRLYQSEKEAFRDLLKYFNKLRDRDDGDVPILQAEGQILEADSRLRGSLADVLDAEARLRRLCHLPLNDGTFLYPSDVPSEAPLDPLWEATLQDALAHRVELRRQKWEIKSLELQLKAANSLTRPRVDLISQGRINGFGDHLVGSNDSDQRNMGGSLGDADNTGWDLGVQVSMPVGLRVARIQVRNYELRLRKARVVLGEQEREVAYELSGALLNMQRWYQLADSTTRRIATAREHVTAVETRVDGNPDATHDLFNLLLQAKINQRDAEQAYTRSIIEYNKALTDLKFRKGTLLIDNAVYLAEGPWNPEAMPIARQRAVARTYAKDKPKLKTEPGEFVGGAAPGAYETVSGHLPANVNSSEMPQPSHIQMSPQPVPPGTLEPPPIDTGGVQQLELIPIPVPPMDNDAPPMDELNPPMAIPQPIDPPITNWQPSHRSVPRRSGLSQVAAEADTDGRIRM